MALKNLKRYEECLKFLDEALVKISRQEYKIQFYVYKGESLCHLNRHEEALVCLDQAITADPKCGDAYNLKIESLEKLNKFDEALALDKLRISITCHYFSAATKVTYNP